MQLLMVGIYALKPSGEGTQPETGNPPPNHGCAPEPTALTTVSAALINTTKPDRGTPAYVKIILSTPARQHLCYLDFPFSLHRDEKTTPCKNKSSLQKYVQTTASSKQKRLFPAIGHKGRTAL